MRSEESDHSDRWGFTVGAVVSLAGVIAWRVSDSESSLQAAMAWLLPATFVTVLVLGTDPRWRRFGTGLMLGSLAVAVAVFLFFMWLAASIGS